MVYKRKLKVFITVYFLWALCEAFTEEAPAETSDTRQPY